MTDAESLFDKALAIANRNNGIYNQWESQIAVYMARRYPEAYAITQQETGNDFPTAIEVADMGAEKIADQVAFINDLGQVLRTLAKGCELNGRGEWV